MERKADGNETWSFPCGSDMQGAMRGCPCGSIVGRHKLAFYAALTAFGLFMLALPVGLTLGVIAFFRTLG